MTVEDAVSIEEVEEMSEARDQNSAQILMRLFNLHHMGRLSMLDNTPLVYAFRNDPCNCHRSTHSVSFAKSFTDFGKNHLPIINNYGAANSFVTVYRLKPENVKKGFDEIGMDPKNLDTAEMQSRILQCAYFLVLKPSIAESYDLPIRGRPVAESGIDRLMKSVL